MAVLRMATFCSSNGRILSNDIGTGSCEGFGFGVLAKETKRECRDLLNLRHGVRSWCVGAGVLLPAGALLVCGRRHPLFARELLPQR